MEKLADLGMIGTNESALDTESETVGTAKAQEVGRGHCDLP